MKRYLFFLLAILSPYAACSQPTVTDSVHTIALPEVAVQGRLVKQVVSTFHGSYIRGTRPLLPQQRCVVWLPAPDSGRLYTLTALLLPLHQRFTAGRLQVSLHQRGAEAEMLGPSLLKQPFLFAPPDSIPKRRTQVRLNLLPEHIQLPTAGVYVVLESLPTAEDEVFIRRAYIQRRKTKKDGSAVVQPYILTRRGTDTTTIWTSTDAFPKLCQSPAGYVSNTWMRWAPHLPYKREGVQTFRGKSVQAFDTVVMLELEPVE
ncbi:hypothetical protein [Hymenobacter perfusus]|uniref:Uncharacterized protein n=1 Tax=Hymenobacter perfusus TaxID=1236770 RepID=A0A428K400_9BACT|nr:hypothetical protein [Hymenobacter perfusus]RSK40974.1 hypothetical protein EI293_18725 [Hymenobacter perfusus]